jgi:hypothetical protein
MAVSAQPKTVTVSVVLDSSGRVVGASKPSDYRPAKEGDEPVVTVGLAVGPDQSVVEVEVPADLTDLDASGLLSRLAEHTSVRAVVASLPTSGAAPTTGGSSLGSSQSLPAGANLSAAVITSGSI